MSTVLEVNGSKSSLMLQNLLALETINVNYTGDGSTILQINGSKSSLRVIYKSALLRLQTYWPLRQSMLTILEMGQLSCRSMAPSLHWESQGNVGAGVYSELFSSMAPSHY
ncbi:unnamed protein product [Rodentolepis nana]|uniref:Uncharacterized protein n=1 Tax=Rodentolepis nana TaxID=102285 RepID=A0A0R3TF66_RODNA|nr:unnamed protein product [Rodentolepis nana]